MMYEKYLKNHEHASAYVRIYNDGTIELISYTTLVCRISSEGLLTCTGTYSATTRKHIGWFMREYLNSNYHVAKKCYIENLAYNIHEGYFMSLETGEVLSYVAQEGEVS